MRKNSYGNECIAVIGSTTQAMNAQGVLARAGIRVEMIKAADSMGSGRGCAYALSFPCEQEATVKTVLRTAGIRVRSIQRSK